ncbi:MAG: polymer-forming cytoskeletal protein [Pseudomonadota bacterium]
MFGQKPKTPIDTLIGACTCVEGNIRVKGGVRIDGRVTGDVIAEPEAGGLLIISESARIEGAVRGAHVVVNGEIVGPVHSTELLELQPNARITGDVTYKALEMHGGAVVNGRLTPQQAPETVLKLAAAST